MELAFASSGIEHLTHVSVPMVPSAEEAVGFLEFLHRRGRIGAVVAGAPIDIPAPQAGSAVPHIRPEIPSDTLYF